MPNPQQFRLRTDRSGREVIREVDPEAVYVDAVTAERYEVQAAVIPLAPSESNLPRTPENLRTCNHCGELVGLDLNDCPLCHRRLKPLGQL
jgi:hypothetical protein